MNGKTWRLAAAFAVGISMLAGAWRSFRMPLITISEEAIDWRVEKEKHRRAWNEILSISVSDPTVVYITCRNGEADFISFEPLSRSDQIRARAAMPLSCC